MKKLLLTLALALPLAAQPQMQQQPDMTIDAPTRARVIDQSVAHLNKAYIFADKAKEMETAVRARQKKGEYDSITSAKEFARTLTEDLRAVSKDKHLRVIFNAQPRSARGQGPARPADFARMTNYGFEKVQRLQGNVGYIDLRGFVDPDVDGGAARDTAVAAMNLVANTDSLIFDLRENGGGSPGMIQLITTYLYEAGAEPVHLNTFYDREDDETTHTWTLKDVPGRRYGKNKPIYVLTSNRTFSAAEEFSYNLRNLERATLVGETTGGGAHPGGPRPIDDHFDIWVPTGRAINPITKTNWEGVGVQPHVVTSKDEALKTAHVAALQKLRAAAEPERQRMLDRALESLK
jgi:retinol-binding protein 3